MRFIIRLSLALVSFCIAIFFIVLTISFLGRQWGMRDAAERKNHVSVVELNGVIISSTNFVRELDRLLDQKTTKAIVVRINSPGGLVAPSQEIYEAIKAADKKVPVVISMGSLAASGGYYAALGGRKVFANPGTLTASIGVIMEFVNLERLYDWARMRPVTLKAGKFKDVGSSTRPMKPEERALLENLLADIHTQFRTAVKERRKLTDAELDAAADGRIVSGQQAKALKLVDVVGGFEDAAKEARSLAGLPADAPVDFRQKRKGALREFLLGEEDDSSESEASALSIVFNSLKEHAFLPGWKVMLISPVVR